MNKTIIKKIMFTLFLIFFIFLLSNSVKADNFTISKNDVEMKLNSTTFLTYNGGEGTVTWESDNTKVATVESGTIKAVGIGTATITAKRGEESAKCTVNVIYGDVVVYGNNGNSNLPIHLYLGEHSTEQLTAEIKDYLYEDVPGVKATWTSSAPDVVKVDSSTGLITALKAGTATITAKVTGAEDSCEVVVHEAPIFTDFSNANYETNFDSVNENLKITGIVPTDTSSINYYYLITPTNEMPELKKTPRGFIDTDNMPEINYFLVNADENYIYTRDIAKYTELNQDLYLWVIQTNNLSEAYFIDEDNYISAVTKYVVEGKKLERAELPPLNLIIQGFHLGHYIDSEDNTDNNRTSIRFNYPSITENRKFKLKIGKVTDYSILTKIKNNDYNGIVELLSYAKNNNAVYESNLVTTDVAYYSYDGLLFDGNQLLEDDAYYYIYAEFDDENGKYYPIEGVTLGLSMLFDNSDEWDLFAYTSSDFNWDNLKPTFSTTDTPTDTPSKKDDTTAPGNIPQTGSTGIVFLSLISITGLSVVSYIKYKKFKDIK